MTPEKDWLLKALEELTDREDLAGLNELVRRLDNHTLQTYKTDLTEAYLVLFSIWQADLMCGKIRETDQEALIAELMDILSAIEKIDPESRQYIHRGQCFELLSDLKSNTTEKQACIQHAIDEYTRGINHQPSPQLYARLADALVARMRITQHFENDNLAEIFHTLQSAFTTFSETALYSFLHASFEIRLFPFPQNQHWYDVLIKHMDEALIQFAKEEPLIYLSWSERLFAFCSNQYYTLPAAHAEQLRTKSITLLEPLMNYETGNISTLNNLGSSFERAAKQITLDALAQKLLYYEKALHYYTEGQNLNPAAWTFPVYATNVLMAMAALYHREQDHTKVVALCEQGRTIFAKTHAHGNDFTLTLNWGEFLIDYARLVQSNLDTADILRDAESKLLIAKSLGNNYYSQPFLGLAKVYLKMGNTDRCMDTLKECKSVFTTKYSEYTYSDVLEDEDFKSIWPLLQS